MAARKKPKAGAKAKAEAKRKPKAAASPASKPAKKERRKPGAPPRAAGKSGALRGSGPQTKARPSPGPAKGPARPAKRTSPAPKAAGKQLAQKPPARRKIRRRPARRPPALLSTVSVGDAVRIPVSAADGALRSETSATQQDRSSEALEGIVSSIREIATGKLVAKTTGDLAHYVLEVVHSQTFQLHYASDRNTGGPRGAEDFRQSPIWRSLRSVLRQMAAAKRLVSVSQGGATEEPLRSLLDGWRVVKVKARQAEAMA